MSGTEAMILAAEASLGTYGVPNAITRWYAARNGSYFSTAPWCNMSVTYWAHKSGNYREVCFGEDFAYTVYHAQRFQRAGQWHTNTAGIRRGDIVFFDWAYSNSVGAIDHVGIVASVKGADVHTIEGNTSRSCARRVRRANTIVGYGRPQYKEPKKTTPKPAELPWVSFRLLLAAGRSRSGVAQISGNSSKDDVLLYQKALKKVVGLNYSSGPGIYGPLTTAATRKFQKRQGWTGAGADGIVGPETARRLASQSGLFRVRDF